MRVRVMALLVCLTLAGFSRAIAQDQTIIVTNGLTQITEELGKDDGSLFYMPDGLGWEVYGIGYWQPLWIDFSEYPSLQKLKSNATLSANPCVVCQSQYGVQPLHVTVTLDLLSGDLVLSPGCSSEELASVAAPKGYEAGKWPANCRVVERLWQDWQKIQADPDWKEWYGSDARPFLTFHFQLADLINEKPIYDETLAAEEAAWEAAWIEEQAAPKKQSTAPKSGSGGMMMLMGGGCTITNEAEPFAIIAIEQGTNGWTTVTWESCSDHIYGVFSAEELSWNTEWVAQVAMWGEDGATSWTDTTTSGVTSEFYKVVRMSADAAADYDGDGMPNAWEVDHGMDPMDAADADMDFDEDGYSNLTEFLNGTDPWQADAPLDILVNNGNPYTASLAIPLEPLSTNYPNILVSVDPSMTNAVTLENTGDPIDYTLADEEGLHNLYLQYADEEGSPHSAVIPKAVTVDRVTPTVMITAPASNAVLDQAFITLEGVAFDPDPVPSNGVRQLTIWINNEPYWDRSVTNIVVKRFPVPAGTNSFTVALRVADGAGHTNTASRTWTVDPSGDIVAPQLTNFNITANTLLPDIAEVWIEAMADDEKALVTAVVNGISTNSLSVCDQQVEGFIPLDVGTNTVVVSAKDAAGNITSNLFMVVRADRYRAVITSPVFGEFATAASNVVSGYVSAKFDEGLATETNVTTVTINGVEAVLDWDNMDEVGNVPFTSAQAIPLDEPITGSIGGPGIPTNPAPTIPPTQSQQYEVLHREWHKDTVWALHGDYAMQPERDYYDCQIVCSEWWSTMARHTWDDDMNGTNESYEESTWHKVGSSCVANPHPETFSWEPSQTWQSNYTVDNLSKDLWFGTYTLDGSGYFPEHCYDGTGYRLWHTHGQDLLRERHQTALTFRAPRQYGTNTTVIFTFEGMDNLYMLEDTTPLDLAQVKFRGQSPIAWSNEIRTVSYLLTVDGGREYTLSQDDFEWPPWTAPIIVTGGGDTPFVVIARSHSLSWTNFHNVLVSPRSIDFVGHPLRKMEKAKSGFADHYGDAGSVVIDYPEWQRPPGNGTIPNVNEPAYFTAMEKPQMVVAFDQGILKANDHFKIEDEKHRVLCDYVVSSPTTNITLDWAVTVTNSIGRYRPTLTWLYLNRHNAWQEFARTEHDFFIALADPIAEGANTATVARVNYAVFVAAQGAKTEAEAAEKTFNRLSWEVAFDLNQYDVANPWVLVDNKKIWQSDCISLATLMKFSLNLAGVSADTQLLYATRNNDVSSLETTNMVVDGQARDCDLLFYNGGTNNFEGVCVVAGRYYAPKYLHCDNPLNVLLSFVCPNTVASGKYQAWAYSAGGQLRFATNTLPVALPVSCPSGLPTGCTQPQP
jgi:hypothetical protein